MCKSKRAWCPSLGIQCHNPEGPVSRLSRLRICNQDLMALRRLWAPSFSVQSQGPHSHRDGGSTRPRHTCMCTRHRLAPRGPSPSCLLHQLLPHSPFLGKQKRICQPKNHREFAFSMGGFWRCQGRPPPGTTAAPRSQDGRARVGKRVGAEGPSSRTWCPTHAASSWANSLILAPRLDAVGQHGLRSLSTSMLQAPGCLQTEPRFAHLYNGDAPVSTPRAGPGRHCSVPCSSPELSTISPLCGSVTCRFLSGTFHWVERTRLLALGREDTGASLSHPS